MATRPPAIRGRTASTSVSGGVISTTFAYDAKGNMTSGNGLSVSYTAFNKPATITRGTASVAFDHDPEHQRYAQTSPGKLLAIQISTARLPLPALCQHARNRPDDHAGSKCLPV